MSWSMWHVDGIGFDVEFASPERLQEFLENHMHSLRQAECSYVDALEDYLWDGPLEKDQETDEIDFESIRELTNCYALAEPVAIIMTEETGIRFVSPGLTDGTEDYVLFDTGYPWDYNDTELALTKQSLLEIMDKYAAELGLEVNDAVDLVYAG